MDLNVIYEWYVIQFFAMHETFYTYRFEPAAKKHLPFFSCFVKKSFMLHKNHPYFVKHQCFVNNKSSFYFVPWHLFIFCKALPEDRPRFQLMSLM
jgi:hypothetical protein